MNARHLGVALVGLLASGAALGAPNIVSDPTTVTAVTHCAWYMDATPRQLVVAPKDSSGKPYCKLDVAAIATGAHSVTAAFVVDDPVWGTQEGPKSDPFAFTRPAAPPKPSGLTVRP
jgi:hypothetical protein